jgi:hypothetical protein
MVFTEIDVIGLHGRRERAKLHAAANPSRNIKRKLIVTRTSMFHVKHFGSFVVVIRNNAALVHFNILEVFLETILWICPD